MAFNTRFQPTLFGHYLDFEIRALPEPEPPAPEESLTREQAIAGTNHLNASTTIGFSMPDVAYPEQRWDAS